MFQVCSREISGNLNETVRRDFDRAVTSRYERRDIAAAIAG